MTKIRESVKSLAERNSAEPSTREAPAKYAGPSKLPFTFNIAPAIGGPVKPPQAQIAIVIPIIDPMYLGSGVICTTIAACKLTMLPMNRPEKMETQYTPAAE